MTFVKIENPDLSRNKIYGLENFYTYLIGISTLAGLGKIALALLLR